MFKNAVNAPLWACLTTALVLRICLVIYGTWQDETQVVKYTDVDYFVFTDAARFVTEGKSPYERTTYRYTPLLAWLLTANIFVHPSFGKMVFVIFDVFTGWMIHKNFLLSRTLATEGGLRNSTLDSMKSGPLMCRRPIHAEQSTHSVFFSALWLFNPIPAVVASRGNAEPIMCALVLGVLYLLRKQKYFYAAVLYGISVHVKIYPVTYALPIFFYINFCKRKQKSSDWLQYIINIFLPSKDMACFAAVSGVTMLGLVSINFIIYGSEFLEETYLYHITRKDIRHNMSVYFYMFYLYAGSEWSVWVGLLAFLPQVVLLCFISFLYFENLELCWFLHTFTFVAFNKVCTSQYFLWYLCLVPLVVYQMKSSLKMHIVIWVQWSLAQVLWLAAAFSLEFEGQNTFLFVWIAGIVIFMSNIFILYSVVFASPRYISFKSDKLKCS